jgi:hypothetical protein
MRRRLVLLALAVAILAVPHTLQAACTTIKDGTLLYPSGHYLVGQPLKPGFDIFGYNYQAHLFNGSYANAYLGRDGFPPYEGNDLDYLTAHPSAEAKWYWPYRTVTLGMKWNDAWLSNMDCSGDGALDRYYGFLSYIGSGAWETNHMSELVDGVHWTSFTKIVAVPADATNSGGTWYTAGDVEIGQDIWGAFAIIQDLYNDPALGFHGIQYKSPASPGFGAYAP